MGDLTGEIGVTTALESLDSISYARVSFLTSYLASTDTNSFLFLPRQELKRSTQPRTMAQRPSRKSSQIPFIWIKSVTCESV